jgi:DNA-binding NtrC family response regulator
VKVRNPGGSLVDAPAPGEGGTLRDARRRFERSYILSALARHDWSVPAAARSLGLQRPNLYRKARQLSIPLKPPGKEL